MKMTIEIEDSVYNTLSELCKRADITPELMVERLLTETVALIAANPDAAVAILEKSSEVPEYRHMMKQVGKPAPQEE